MATPDMSQFSVNAEDYYNPFPNVTYGLTGDIKNWLGGNRTRAVNDWNAFNTYLDKLYEQDTLAMQRQYEMYMDSTRYQRLVEDLKKAGLNPWLALNGGSASAGSVSIGSQGGSTYKSSKVSDDTSNKNLSQLAKIITAGISSAMMVAMFLA